MTILALSRHELCQFLALAKQKTFANDAPRTRSKCVLSKNYVFEDGDFRYEDQYFGEYVDVGEEIVWFKDLPIWGMGYRGGMHAPFFAESNLAFDVLKKALCLPDITFPVRGPCQFQCENYHYYNYPTGNIFSFTGHEVILRDSVEIYFRNYVGGLIHGKHNVDMSLTE